MLHLSILLGIQKTINPKKSGFPKGSLLKTFSLYKGSIRPYFLGAWKTIVYHNFRQLWLVLGIKLMEINSNLFSSVVTLAGPLEFS